MEPASTPDLPPAPAEETDSLPVADTPVIAEVPQGTEVLVLDEQGQAVPLVTQEAAEIIAAADPIWCPAGVAIPKPLMNGCTASYTSFTALITYLDANEPAKDGVIWIEKGFDSGTGADSGLNFMLNGATNFRIGIHITCIAINF